MGQDLHLNRGKSSKSLLDVGGQGLMAEIETRYPNGVKHGEVATISGGNLQCQELYLGYLPGWKDGNGKVCILEKYYGNAIIWKITGNDDLQKSFYSLEKKIQYMQLGVLEIYSVIKYFSMFL